MATKQSSTAPSKDQTSPSSIAETPAEGVGSMLGLSAFWMEAMSDMGAEVLSFVAERIKEDVKTQHQLLHCKNLGEVQHIQTQFIQKALDQYQAETGKLVEMSAKAFSVPPSK
ncbi:MAG: phasin family protein [Pseudomonadota bacterium]